MFKRIKFGNRWIIKIAILTAMNLNSQNIDLDKQAHFLGGAYFGSLAYQYTLEKTGDEKKALLASIAGSVFAGLAKEIYDSTQPGNGFDHQDLLASGIGGITIGFKFNLINKDKHEKKINRSILRAYAKHQRKHKRSEKRKKEK